LSTGKTMDLQTTVARNEDIIFSNMDDETVMMSIEKGEYYGINPVGRRIWELLETPVTVAGICEVLGNEYNVSPEQCRNEVLAFLTQMSEKDIIKVMDE
jgi:hypothetical protein